MTTHTVPSKEKRRDLHQIFTATNRLVVEYSRVEMLQQTDRQTGKKKEREWKGELMFHRWRVDRDFRLRDRLRGVEKER